MAILTRTATQSLALSEVATFFGQTPGTAQLSQYNRGGGIVPIFPQVGGIVLRYPANSFTIQDDASLDVGWADTTPQLLGASDNWTYFAEPTAVVDSQNSLRNTLTNNTGGTLLNATGRIEVDLTVTNIMAEGSTTQTQCNLLARPVTSTAAGTFTDTAGNASFRVRDNVLNMGANTIVLARTGTQFTVANGNGIRFAITETDDNFTPFTCNITEVRISFTNAAFNEINATVPEDGANLRLSQLRNVDDGEN